jgi:hypothetical protein
VITCSVVRLATLTFATLGTTVGKHSGIGNPKKLKTTASKKTLIMAARARSSAGAPKQRNLSGFSFLF